MSYHQPSCYSKSSTTPPSSYLQHHSLSSPMINRFSHLSLSSADSHHSSVFPPLSVVDNRRLSNHYYHSSDIPIHRLSINSPHHHHQSLSTPTTLRSAFLLLTDSHGRAFPPLFETPEYSITTKSISGLSWSHSYNSSLCTFSLLTSSSSFSSDVANFSRILFIIGSNSIRNTRASVIIDQIASLIDYLRNTYAHLDHPAAIGITYTFPCYKTSRSFPSLSSLHSNLHHYNSRLRDLAFRKNFLLLDLFITPTHLTHDGLHLHPSHCSTIWSSIMTYFASSVPTVRFSSGFQTNSSFNPETVSHSRARTHTRSRTAIATRNRKRHLKLRLRQQSFVVVRSIDSLWRLSDVKNYLDYQQIIYANIPHFRHQQISIRFHNRLRQEHAERTLSTDIFDVAHYHHWQCQGH
uniref:GDSL esterase/lipase n=1 Tax=Adineta vaga TaxID=104782 RepID=A0A1W6BQZ5_ADIVA|nr:GDSL esterase/lipase [Adineta vaga]